MSERATETPACPPHPALEDFRELSALLIGCALPARGGLSAGSVLCALPPHLLFADGGPRAPHSSSVSTACECAALNQAERSSFFGRPAPRGVLQGLVSPPRPAPESVTASVHSLWSRGLCLGRGGGKRWPPWQVATPVLKAAEPRVAGQTMPACNPASPQEVACPLWKRARHAKAWLASPRGL